MSDLGEQLERLGLSEYLERFSSEGFDTWDTVLDITESDLTALDVKLGHRRKLQRAIAESRGQPLDRALLFEQGKVTPSETGYQSDESAAEAKDFSGQVTPARSTGAPATGTKRKYRRHPKADENAPERPPSAYVIFSNQVRIELKGHDLSFTEIAKLVGERWQVLDPAVREACEKQAASAKEKYYAQMSKYKKTQRYQDYQQYLTDFKVKHATPRTDGKRSKLHTEASDASNRGLDLDKSIGGGSRSGSGTASGSSGGPNLAEPSIPGHYRSPSNLSGTGLTSLGKHHSASTSPALFSTGLHSPVTQHAYSPRSSPPASVSISSYDLPSHSRSRQSLTDTLSKDYFSNFGPSSSHWQRSPVEEARSQSPLVYDYTPRRQARASGSLPPLIHQDTSLSSHSDSLPPPTPYQTTLLPPLDPSKSDRFLPHPIPSMVTASLVSSPLDMQSHQAAPHLPQIQTRPPDLRSSQFHALLRASELARDADLQDEAGRRSDSAS